MEELQELKATGHFIGIENARQHDQALQHVGGGSTLGKEDNPGVGLARGVKAKEISVLRDHYSLVLMSVRELALIRGGNQSCLVRRRDFNASGP